MPKEDEEHGDDWKDPTDGIKKVYADTHLLCKNVLLVHSSLLRYILVFVSSFSFSEKPPVTILSSLAISSVSILKRFNKLKEIKSEKLELDEAKDVLRKDLSETFVRSIHWHLSRLAYKFVHVQKEEKDDEEETNEEKINKKLLNSKMFSGGIENRFTHIFHKEVRNSLKDLV